jgi:hypothetical protein
MKRQFARLAAAEAGAEPAAEPVWSRPR